MAPPPGARSPGPLRRGRGFTLIELVVASVIFTLLGGIVFQFFTKGSRAGAKATWRTQAAGKTRSAVRQMKQLIEASSFPSAISLQDYLEQPAGFEFNILVAGTDNGGTTTFVFDRSNMGAFVRFFRCHPRDLTPMAPPVGELNGFYAQHTFRLRESEDYPGERLDLVVDTATGPVNADLDPTGIVNFGPGSLGDSESIVLATEVENVTMVVPTGMIGEPNAVATIRVTCQDPVDGRMRVVEEARANINVTLVAGGP